MNNKIFPLAISLFILFSCNNNNASVTENNGGEVVKSEKEKKISKRDFSINVSNGYNNIFFDSLALVKFIETNQIPDTLSRRMISFYNTRNYQYAWFSSDGLTEQARGFWNMYNYYMSYSTDSSFKDPSLKKTMGDLITEEELSVSPNDKNILNAELKLTRQFILYALNNIEDGYIKRKEMERFIPVKKENAIALADSLINKKHKDNKYYEDVNESYKLLKQQLVKYLAIAKNGGWPLVNVSAKQFKKGQASADVVSLKKRLFLSQDLASMDSTQLFNDALEGAIQKFQSRHGYTPTGILTDAQLKDMNVPVVDRIQQILINMGRMQWMINQPAGQLIVVNIPEFILHVKDGSNKVFDMDVVVGKEGHNTMIFTGKLDQIVFSPYWNVPSSIVKKEILPAIQRNHNYLANNNMEITGNEGGLPVVRQLPGLKNSLGRVKFLFPNSFDIYFHDTPAKSLFEKDKRAYSHGCIRLSDPSKMANYLLKDDASWDSTKIEEAMNSGNQQFVKLKKTVPVLITYYTAWVDDSGLLHFAEDIYGHDKSVAQKMFGNT